MDPIIQTIIYIALAVVVFKEVIWESLPEKIKDSIVNRFVSKIDKDKETEEVGNSDK